MPGYHSETPYESDLTFTVDDILRDFYASETAPERAEPEVMTRRARREAQQGAVSPRNSSAGANSRAGRHATPKNSGRPENMRKESPARAKKTPERRTEAPKAASTERLQTQDMTRQEYEELKDSIRYGEEAEAAELPAAEEITATEAPVEDTPVRRGGTGAHSRPAVQEEPEETEEEPEEEPVSRRSRRRQEGKQKKSFSLPRPFAGRNKKKEAPAPVLTEPEEEPAEEEAAPAEPVSFAHEPEFYAQSAASFEELEAELRGEPEDDTQEPESITVLRTEKAEESPAESSVFSRFGFTDLQSGARSAKAPAARVPAEEPETEAPEEETGSSVSGEFDFEALKREIGYLKAEERGEEVPEQESIAQPRKGMEPSRRSRREAAQTEEKAAFSFDTSREGPEAEEEEEPAAGPEFSFETAKPEEAGEGSSESAAAIDFAESLRTRFGRAPRRKAETAAAAPTDPAADNAGEKDDFDTYNEGEEDFFDNELGVEGASIPSFRDYVQSLIAVAYYKIRGFAGNGSAATMSDDEEYLGPEVGVKEASAYYGSMVTGLRLRLRVAVVLMVFLAYISLGFPLPGMLKNAAVKAAFCFGLQGTVMLCACDIVTRGILNAVRRKPGADTMAVLACLLTGLDALLVAKNVVNAHIPLCALSSLAVTGLLLAAVASARGLRKCLRVPAIATRCYTVTAERREETRNITLLKSVRPSKGFVRRTEEAGPDEELYRKFFLYVLALALLLGIIALLAHKGSACGAVYVLSAVIVPLVPCTALLASALPFFIGSNSIFPSGASLAGWSGICDIGRSRDLIITDRDLFPDGTVDFDDYRVGRYPAERVLSYAGSMITASGSCLAPCFGKYMQRCGGSIRRLENFEFLPGGGMKAIIDGDRVLCGNIDTMNLMHVRTWRKAEKNTVFLAINGELCGIFYVKYTADSKIRDALVELMRTDLHPIFAIRDFNVTPEMLAQCFDIPTDGYDFPPYVERFDLTSAETEEGCQVSAVVCREGLGPLTHLVASARKMYSVIRANTVITAAAALLGLLIVFCRLLAGDGDVGSGFMFLYMALSSLPVFFLSLFTNY